MQVKQFFSAHLKASNKSLGKLRIKSTWIGWVRFLLFLLILYTMYRMLFDKNPDLLLYLVPLTVVFGLLLFYHQRIKDQTSLLVCKASIIRQELDRIDSKFPKGREGELFEDKHHEFSLDMDLFGNGSLFHQIDRTETRVGSQVLSEYLLKPLEYQVALDRQETLEALALQNEWRVEWQASLASSKLQEDNIPIDMSFPVKLPVWSRIIGISLVILALVIISLWMLDVLPFNFVLGVFPINLGFLFFHQKKLIDVSQYSTGFTNHLKANVNALHLVQSLSDHNASELHSISSHASTESEKAFQSLSQLIFFLESRANMLYWLVNPILMLDLWIVDRLSKWSIRHHADYNNWMDTVHKIDAWVSLAGYAALHEDFHYPTLEKEGRTFDAEGLRHPLISDDQVIANDFRLSDEKLAIVTGSNMSGKSTFLRTIGVGHLMAWAGLPVPAMKMNLSRFHLYSSMRTTDDVRESTSSFYAELKRIKRLLDLLNSEPQYPVLYFIDEILKGTNSTDRHLGAVGLIDQLLDSNSFGFISTHDLALPQHFTEEKRIKNYSFNSQIIEDSLRFDYKLTNGVCKSTNASKLMEGLGIIQPTDTI